MQVGPPPPPGQPADSTPPDGAPATPPDPSPTSAEPRPEPPQPAPLPPPEPTQPAPYPPPGPPQAAPLPPQAAPLPPQAAPLPPGGAPYPAPYAQPGSPYPAQYPQPGSPYPAQYPPPGSAYPPYAPAPYPPYALSPGAWFAPPAPAGPSPWAIVAAVFVGIWAVAVTVGAQAVGWLIDQVLLATGLAQPPWAAPLIGLVDAVLVGLPALLLAILPRSAAVRSAGRAWLIGALALGALGLLRAIPAVQNEVYLAALAASAAVAAVIVHRGSRRGAGRARPAPAGPRTSGSVPTDPLSTSPNPAGPNPANSDPTDPNLGDTAPGGPDPAGTTPGNPDPAGTTPGSPDPLGTESGRVGLAGGTAAGAGPAGTGRGRARRVGPAAVLAIAAGLGLLLPWLWLGALGGLLETGLAIAAAAAVGSLAAAVLDPPFWAPYGDDPAGRPHPVRLVLVGGLVAGVALLLLAGAIGQPGAQLAAMLVLPPAGFALAALRRLSTASGGTGPAAVRWLVGLAALGPLAFADPEEISLLLATGRDVPYWAAVAAAGSLAVALLLGLAYGVAFGRTRAAIPRRWLAVGSAVVVLLAAAGVYAGPGQPGFHGERLFVVLREQADLGGIPAGTGQAGRDARAREVYRRLVDTAERSQAGLRHDLDRLHLRYTPYYLVNAVEVDAGPAARAWLSRRPGVDRVLLDERLRPLPAPAGVTHGEASAPAAPSWNIAMIGADRVRGQLGVDGAGIVVGSSDSGVDGRHPALAAGFRGGDDSWYDPWNGTRSPTDHGGHGTHTMATAVGGQNVGVAPGAHWIGCVNLDRNLGNPARYLDCLQFMLAPFPAGGNAFTDGRPERAPQVLTNSWGCPRLEGCDQRSLAPATAALAAAGIFFVAAAGNTGPYCGSIDDPPAPYADVLSVGAVDRNRRVTDFSSRGPAAGGAAKPDVVAPGAEVLSAMPGGGYTMLDGTSMAAPHVAGVVALMWSANPALIGDLDRTRAILRDTAVPANRPSGSPDPAGGCGPAANSEGAGLVDAYAAVLAARRAAGRPG